jgi:release factor glutamine methyltransferase
VDRDALVSLLAREGFIAAEAEAAELLAAAGADGLLLDAMIARRLRGEPLAWITGGVVFAGIHVVVSPGVYVPRFFTEPLALRAASLLPVSGVALDLCCGSGAVACVLRARVPSARIIGTDLDPRAVACAMRNGVEAYRGDLFGPVPAELRGGVDVVVAVVPYVPTAELPMLQRDTFAFETALAYDGGSDGTLLLRRVIAAAPVWLRAGGSLLLELGGSQDKSVAEDLARAGFVDVETLRDEDGDLRGIAATLGPGGPAG